MFKVAICDNEEVFITKLAYYIEKYSMDHNVKINIKTYTDGNQLVQDIRSIKYDMILLDICMPNIDGFEIADKVRKMDQEVSIVFVTSYYTIGNGMKGYMFNTLEMIKKPVTYDKLKALMHKIYSHHAECNKERIIIKNKDGIFTVNKEDIVYLKTHKKDVLIYTMSEKIMSYKKIRDFEKSLKTPKFFRCHNSYIVNSEFIHSIKENNIILITQDIIPMSKYRRKDFMRNLAEFIGNIYMN